MKDLNGTRLRLSYKKFTRALSMGNTIKIPKNFIVDYYYIKEGSRTRTKLTGSVAQNLQNATTETAVLTYLRRLRPGYEIVMMSLEWK